MYIFTTLEFPTHSVGFHLLTASVAGPSRFFSACPVWFVTRRNTSLLYIYIFLNTVSISVDCRSLIRLMLDPDEKTRITCEGILEDTWCEQGMEKVVDEMRRPSLAPDDTRSLPVTSNRKRSSIVPKPPTLPTIHSTGKQNISRCGEIPTSIGTR